MKQSDNYTEKELAKLQRKINKIFTRTEKEVVKKALDYLSAFKKEDDDMRYKFQNKLITDKEYYSWRQAKMASGKRYNKLLNQINRELIKAGLTAYELINGNIPQIYAANYNSIAEYLNSIVSGYTFNIVNKDVFEQMIDRKEIMLPPPKKVNIPKLEKWNAKRINGEVLQGILQGESIPKIAGRLVNVTNSNLYLSNRNARTMVTAAQNSGRSAGISRVVSQGAILQKVWMAAHDNRVRNSHATLDGEACEHDEAFSNGLKFPGDWNGRPEEVYNCRCTLGVKYIGFRRD